MFYIRTNKNHVIFELSILTAPIPNEDEHVYPIELEAMPDEVISNLSAYAYDGLHFTRLDPAALRNAQIETYRTEKLRVMSNTCNALIVNGIDYENKHYSLDTNDQINISRLAFEAQRPHHQPLIYHADGEPTRVYTEQEILDIDDKANAWITYNTCYYNLLKQYIETIESADIVASINYFQQLPPQYQSQLDEMVDISDYPDFPIYPIIDSTDYSYINPVLDATGAIEEYKRMQLEETKNKYEPKLD